MKVCFLTDDPFVTGGGPEHIRQTTKILREKYGVDIDVISPLAMDKHFDFHNFWQRVKFTFWVLEFLLTSDYDLYHSHTFSTDAFLPLAKLRGKKTAITVHGKGSNLIGGAVLNALRVPAVLAWLVLDVWPYDYRFSASNLKGYIRVGNGVDVGEFDSEKAKPDQKYFTVLCVSRRDPVKGVEVLEEAIKMVREEYPNVRLNLISTRKRTARDFKAADIYVLPSLSEGLPIVLLEAMAAKLPIIATDVGDCREIVETAGCGFVVKPADQKMLVRAIVDMIKNESRKEMGERGYGYVKENFTWVKVAASYYSAYCGANPGV